jgi:hypothetical protein
MTALRTLLPAVLLSTVVGAAQWGRGEVATRTAEIRGGAGESGKCTIEVEVDGSAQVEIRGDTAQLRTLSGQPATWRRFVCNARPPERPLEFRFRGIDGRGRQSLLQDPRDRGVAVILIEDPKSGREGYTFDIEWRGVDPGGSGGSWRGGRSTDAWGGSNWNQQVRSFSPGDGVYRHARGSDRLSNCRVLVDRSGRVDVSFDTDKNYRLNLSGRVIRGDRDRIVADMAGPGISGPMEIWLDGAGGVREVTMSAPGRGGFDLRWRK